MSEIHVLPKSVSMLIAAGEVVERPASVVKELAENSIDAGADNVTVEIRSGGIAYIRVTDNGSGIHREDVATAFITHATSKLKNAEGLNAIFTLGFRGEALPSIAAVSRLQLITKTEDEPVGTLIAFEDGVQSTFTEAGCPKGTTVTVRDLFYNVPARMKFLRRDITEGTYVTEAVIRIALSHPNVSFTLMKDGKRVFQTPGNGEIYSAVYALFGKETAASLLSCDYTVNGIHVTGFISKPLCNRPNRNMQYYFVNGRCVRLPAAVPALDEAYKNSIMVGKFPMCFLFLDIDAAKIDVNVHPAKSEIRFSEETKIYEAVYYAAKNALVKGDTVRPQMHLPEKNLLDSAVPEYKQLKMEPPAAQKTVPVVEEAKNNTKNDIKTETLPEEKILVFRDATSQRRPAEKIDDSEKAATGYRVPWQNSEKASVNYTVPMKTEERIPREPTYAERFAAENRKNPDEEKKPSVRVLGEIFFTYIVAEYGNKLLLIDKHAAHERMIFNELTKRSQTENTQLLLIPQTVSLTPGEYAAVTENKEVFRNAGYILEDFGDNAVLVRGCPVLLTGQDVAELVTEMAGKLERGAKTPVPEKLDWLFHSAACRAAVKAGNISKPEEMQRFAEKLLADPDIMYCPHGRPVLYELTKSEIEKQFGRI